MGRVLVNLSGGLDSAYCLFDTLRQGRRALVHHIRLSNRCGRQPHERQAVGRVLDWLTEQGLTNWSYVESGFDYGTLPGMVQDVTVWGWFTGAILANTPDVEDVVVPRHVDSFHDPAYGRWSSETLRSMVRLLAGREPNWLLPIADMTKADVVAACPPGLAERCWSCRRPRDEIPCGNCRTCRQIADALRSRSHAQR